MRIPSVAMPPEWATSPHEECSVCPDGHPDEFAFPYPNCPLCGDRLANLWTSERGEYVHKWECMKCHALWTIRGTNGGAYVRCSCAEWRTQRRCRHCGDTFRRRKLARRYRRIKQRMRRGDR